MDWYAQYMDPEEQTRMKARALAEALRGQRNAGNLGLLTGDKVLGAFGASQLQQAQQQDERSADAGRTRYQGGLQKAIADQRAAQDAAEMRARASEGAKNRAAYGARAAAKATDDAGERTKKAAVPGLEVSEGAAPSAEDAKKVKAALAAASRMRGLIKQMEDLHGGSVGQDGKKTSGAGTELFGDRATKMRQIRAQMIAEGKNVAELGALSGPDMGLIEDILGPDPTGLWANTKAALTFGGMDSTAEGLEGVKKWTNSQLDAAMNAYGYKPGKVKVSNGKETLTIPAADLEEAAKDGFAVVE